MRRHRHGPRTGHRWTPCGRAIGSGPRTVRCAFDNPASPGSPRPWHIVHMLDTNPSVTKPHHGGAALSAARLGRRGAESSMVGVGAPATARGVGVAMAVPVRIVGRRLPGSSWSGRHGIHVGVQRGTEVVGLVTGDAADAVFDIDLEVVADTDGVPDFRGPYVHGRRGERFVYLSWGEVGRPGDVRHVPPAEAAPGAAGGAVHRRNGCSRPSGSRRCWSSPTPAAARWPRRSVRRG